MRVRFIWAWLFVFAALSLSSALSAPKKKTSSAAKKTTAATRSTAKTSATKKTAAKKTAAKKTSSRKSSAKTRTASKSRGKSAPRTTWRNRQTAPDPERCREIQEALASRGVLDAAQITGVWGPASSAALKRFQEQQNLTANGKINSLTLIALGLGPKYDRVTSALKSPDSVAAGSSEAAPVQPSENPPNP